MKAVIKSPFIPLLFKQKIVADNKKAGYLTTTKLLLHLKSRKSYKVKYMHQLIKLLENKKQHGKRNWDLIISNKGRENKIGKLVMIGDVKDTLTKGYTEYRLEYGEDTFIIKKPFMSEKNIVN
ncbi:hypothetical protein [Oceanobacillus jeddahense]|uniref:Uncharacterized protein n=1 Tax=Oceanobacillus jeddahense TaxID=1462527 RepID=A0ABY5JUH6_9BACI|nr:hypothetical protein [Oceanobacillus jeddahense]UUI04010.1 hypothetical protein NP439_04780 [Oceanobacillus jeddahense]